MKLKVENDDREKRFRMVFDMPPDYVSFNNGRSVGKQAATIEMPSSIMLQNIHIDDRTIDSCESSQTTQKNKNLTSSWRHRCPTCILVLVAKIFFIDEVQRSDVPFHRFMANIKRAIPAPAALKITRFDQCPALRILEICRAGGLQCSL